ncbi:MAG: cation-translocating P-type ATPase [Candidatus Nomurabacteria bacterium]
MKKIIFSYAENRYSIDVALSILLILALFVHYFRILPELDSVILITLALLGVFPVFVSAVFSILEKEWASMDMLASIALFFSIISNEWASAVFIALMLSSARILEDITKSKTRKNIDALLKLRPEKAKVKQDGKIVEIRTEEVKVGDIVVVDNGDYMPVDGEVVLGAASLNESSLTGESLPVGKEIGDKVSSGTFISSGGLEVKALHVGKDTTLEKIIALVEKAELEKPKTQTLGEKFGKIYLAVMFVGSILLFLITKNLALVLSVVLVVCADDIAIAIPLGYLRAIGSAAKIGVIIKGGKHLETLGNVEVFVFDKTGTLTTGKLKVTHVYASEKSNEDEVLKLGGIVSVRSNHPVSKSIAEFSKLKSGIEIYPENATIFEGKGVVATIDNISIVLGRDIFLSEKNILIEENIKNKAIEFENKGESVTFISKNEEVIGFFAVADTIKKEAKQTVKELYDLGIKKIVMLSGDNERVVRSVANQIGIKEYYFGLLPEDKLEKLKVLNKRYKLAMVGDGVNDAAALSLSDVGIAMGALGSDSAIESAEIVLMNDDVSAIPKIVKLARNVHQVSVQDFGIWIVTNAFGLVLVFAGYIGPSGAAAYNFISDFFPLLNSLRVKVGK